MTKTPVCDREVLSLYDVGGYQYNAVPSNVARQLERSRDALLAALEDVLPYIEGYAEAADDDDPVRELLPKMRAAIREAKGE